MITRFSSRKQRLDSSFLNARLQGAQAYDRIAGYFSSSLLEAAGEALESIQGSIRMVCNSELHEADVATARAASNAMRQEWCAAGPEKYGEGAQSRFARLFELLKSGKLEVRVLPQEKFGLVHGKAGVITLASGKKTAFMGSANETKNAWKLNYELVWEDDSNDAISWVQEEFEALWNHPCAVPLGQFVLDDIERLSKRKMVKSVEVWREDPNEASPVIESPVYRREFGLWEHQKYFVHKAFEAHQGPHGARYVLADMVGLGKTVQLGLAATLMALHGDKPVLILAPKTLVWQWRDELKNLLDVPSAVWTGKAWVDEHGIEHPVAGPEGIKKCPRKFGIVSYGLVRRRSASVNFLKELKYECIIVDEAHNARRRNLGPNHADEAPDPNHLLAFLHQIAPRTKSMLLGTATPVQLYPIEAWDLLDVLSQGTEAVLGNTFSNWQTQRNDSLNLVMGLTELPQDERERWQWIRNPMPPAEEARDFQILRQSLNLSPAQVIAPSDAWVNMAPNDKERVRLLGKDFGRKHNPFIRHIIRRTREYLETTKDPETNEPYLAPVRVNLHGEDEQGTISLPPYLREAYVHAEEFCSKLASRVKGAGFLKTMLLRRVGSTIYAGQRTVEKMLATWRPLTTEGQVRAEFAERWMESSWEDDEDEDALGDVADQAEMKSLTEDERAELRAFLDALKANQERDPKYQKVLELLRGQGWLKHGCIVFSQYYDSITWLADQLTKDFPEEKIGIYAGGARSGIMFNADFTTKPREEIKQMVRQGEVGLLLGTDAASEGLNLQRLGTLINLDLPWNPTKLEQRKGRIQRIGQARPAVDVFNMRYRDSVEDRVHSLLSTRLRHIHQVFGQIPDVLEDVWVHTALGQIERARQTIDAVPDKHPFEMRYHEIRKVPWETCVTVLDSDARGRYLAQGWNKRD
ncbi:MAG: phospholipase D-like domain-containing protein [Planctomycetota bacterium]|nr:phospholipase D-like domain-containing protein [Planctomycetota bacterium]